MRYFSLNAVVEGRYLIIFFVIFLQYEYVKTASWHTSFVADKKKTAKSLQIQ